MFCQDLERQYQLYLKYSFGIWKYSNSSFYCSFYFSAKKKKRKENITQQKSCNK